MVRALRDNANHGLGLTILISYQLAEYHGQSCDGAATTKMHYVVCTVAADRAKQQRLSRSLASAGDECMTFQTFILAPDFTLLLISLSCCFLLALYMPRTSAHLCSQLATGFCNSDRVGMRPRAYCAVVWHYPLRSSVASSRLKPKQRMGHVRNSCLGG